MKFTFACVVGLLFCATTINCQVVQQWGNLSPSSNLFHTEVFIWHNSSPNNLEMRRTFHFPRFAEDEYFFPKIGGVIVTHEPNCPNTDAELRFGGPGSRYVGIDFVSAPGQCIYSTIEIFS